MLVIFLRFLWIICVAAIFTKKRQLIKSIHWFEIKIYYLIFIPHKWVICLLAPPLEISSRVDQTTLSSKWNGLAYNRNTLRYMLCNGNNTLWECGKQRLRVYLLLRMGALMRDRGCRRSLSFFVLYWITRRIAAAKSFLSK